MNANMHRMVKKWLLDDLIDDDDPDMYENLMLQQAEQEEESVMTTEYEPPVYDDVQDSPHSPAKDAQFCANQRNPFTMNMLKPARFIDAERTEEFDRDMFWFQLWDAIVYHHYRVDTGQMQNFLALMIIEHHQGPVSKKKTVASWSTFSPYLAPTKRRFSKLLILHRDNDDEIRKVTGKGFDDLMASMNIPGRKQFIETMWHSIPYSCHVPNVEGIARLSRDQNAAIRERKDSTRNPLRLLPNENVGINMGGNLKGQPRVLFMDNNGDMREVMTFDAARVTKNSNNKREAWQASESINADFFTKTHLGEKTHKTPRILEPQKQAHFVSMMLHTFASDRLVKDGWYHVEDIEVEAKEMDELHQSFKHMNLSL